MGKVSAHGFVSYAADGSPTYLPLKSVSGKIYIVDVSARVILTQLYTNDRTFKDCASAQYIFPVPANGAVCAFKMQSTDGRVVKGVVKERSKAEQEFEMALSQNQFAGLLFEATPDIFVISIGAIPRGQDVEVTVMYVIALSDGDLPGYDQVEFSLPTYVATRYGTPPAALTGPSSSSTHTSLDISVEIQMPTSITSVTSSSHAIKVYTTNVTSSPSPIYTSRVTLNPSGPPPKLNKAFVLSIQAAKLGQPRCVAEVRPKEMSVALSLTFVPRFRMQALPTQEYVFLVDRSGSMAGNRIRHAKEALLLFLKSLPSQGTLFNIFSFGSSSSSLWPSSRKYTASDINIALSHVSAMDADMGGTEIQSGLANTLRSRNPSVPMAVFVLTDGEVYNLDSLLTLVRNEVARSRTSASHNGTQTPTHLRIFTLGVGDSASTALCEGIARNGNGLCLMASEGGDISQKCARLLLASKMAPSGNASDVIIDWGYIPASHSNTNNSNGNGNGQSASTSSNKGKITILYDESHDPLHEALAHRRIILPDPPSIQQAPSRVPDLYPANRFTVSAILSNTLVVPKTVTLSGTLPDGWTISLPPIKVCLALDRQGQGQDVGDLPPLIHTLAAHRIIQELEDGNTDSQGVFDRGDKALCDVVAREAIVRLSERYQLASKFVSFIAVEGVDDDDDDDKDVDVNNGDDTQGNRAGKQRSAAANGDTGSDEDSDDDFYDNDNNDQDVKQNTATNVNIGNAHSSSASGWPGVEPCDPPAQAVNPAFNTAQPQSSGASNSGHWGSTTPPSQSGVPASQQSKKNAASSLPPLVVDPGAPSNPSQRSTQSSQFVNAFTSPNLSGNEASHHTTAPIQRSASTRSGRGVYPLDTVATKDPIEGRSSRHGMRMPGAYPVDDISSSSRARGAVASSRIANSVDPSCPIQRMPGAYPHRGVLLSAGGADWLTLSSGQRRSRTTLTPYPLRNRPQSILYSLETAACIENTVKAVHFDLGSLEEADLIEDLGEEEKEDASPPLFTVTASSKTGLYRAPKKSCKSTAIAPVAWTTGAPIITAARLQSFDGSFELNDDLHALIGKKVSLERLKTVIPARLKGQRDAEKIWATVLAAAYLKKALSDDKEVWIGLWNKAAEYVEMQLSTAGISFAALVDVASKLL